MHDTGAPHTHEPIKEGQTPASPDPKADHDANHQEKKVDGCEFC